jgi:hypothetical protein
MIGIVPITMQNVLSFREVRIRALQDSPNAFPQIVGANLTLGDDLNGLNSLAWPLHVALNPLQARRKE